MNSPSVDVWESFYHFWDSAAVGRTREIKENFYYNPIISLKHSLSHTVPTKCNLNLRLKTEPITLGADAKAGLLIRIRRDPHSFSLLDPDPDSGGKNLRKET